MFARTRATNRNPAWWCSQKPIPWNITLTSGLPHLALPLPHNSASVGPMIKRYCVVNLYDARQPAAWCVSVMRFANWGNAARKRFDPLRNPSFSPPSPPFGQWHGFSICPNVKIVDEMWDGRERGIEHTFARLINLFIECEWKFWKGWRLPLFLLKNWEHHRLIGKFIYLIKYEWNWEYFLFKICMYRPSV